MASSNVWWKSINTSNTHRVKTIWVSCTLNVKNRFLCYWLLTEYFTLRGFSFIMHKTLAYGMGSSDDCSSTWKQNIFVCGDRQVLCLHDPNVPLITRTLIYLFDKETLVPRNPTNASRGTETCRWINRTGRLQIQPLVWDIFVESKQFSIQKAQKGLLFEKTNKARIQVYNSWWDVKVHLQSCINKQNNLINFIN